VRVVAATNRDLAQMVREGSFRQDLFYRIAGFKITIPTLRERKMDIPILAQLLLKHLTKETGIVYKMSKDALEKLVAYDYPGNIRELRSVLIKASARCKHGVIETDEVSFEHLPGCACTQAVPTPVNGGGAQHATSVSPGTEPAPARYGRRSSDRPGAPVPETLRHESRRGTDKAGEQETEADLSLARNEELSIQKLLEQFSNRRVVAEKLGISERTLYRKLRKYGLDVRN
jgi:transcriptional regulator with PAS, ATPase and Fis domain